VDGLLIGSVLAGITVMACKHPKSYEKLYGALLIILLGALAGGTFWDLRNGVGYSRFVVIAELFLNPTYLASPPGHVAYQVGVPIEPRSEASPAGIFR